jgi:hypothetical protein
MARVILKIFRKSRIERKGFSCFAIAMASRIELWTVFGVTAREPNLDGVSTGSGSDLVSYQSAILLTIFDSHG